MKYRIVPVTHYQQNSSIIWCESTRQAAVVDPGGDIDNILDTVDQLGVTLESILLTHGHMDHVGGVFELAQKTEIPIIGPHKADNFWIKALDQQAVMMGFAVQPSFTPDRWLEDGDEVSVGQARLRVIHCPGHTPGHVVFVSFADHLAWVGDVLFKGSIGRSDFPRGDHLELVRSIKHKLLPLGDDIAFVPGHGPMSTFGHERLTNPFIAGQHG